MGIFGIFNGTGILPVFFKFFKLKADKYENEVCRSALIEGRKLASDTGGHFTNYPSWPLPRTNLNVDVLNNSLNYYALADLMLYRFSVNIKHITLCLQTF